MFLIIWQVTVYVYGAEDSQNSGGDVLHKLQSLASREAEHISELINNNIWGTSEQNYKKINL